MKCTFLLLWSLLASVSCALGCMTGPAGEATWSPDRGDRQAILCQSGDNQCDFGCAAPDLDCSPTQITRSEHVAAEIEAFNAALPPDRRAEKYCIMAESPFVFFRGTNHLFWSDFAGDARFASFGGADTRIFVQGDMHVYNLGSFDNDDGVIVYDLNDFDEVVLADYQWDVWRMAVSMVLAGVQEAGAPRAQVGDFVEDFAESYLDHLANYRGRDDELSVVFDKNTAYGRLDEFLADVENHESRSEMLRKWTDKTDGVRAFDLELDDLAAVDTALRDALVAAMPGYATTTGGNIAGIPGYFTVKDAAARLHAGTGSLGVARYYVLIEGATDDPDDDRILDVKRQTQPTAYPYMSASERAHLDSAVASDAERAVIGYRALLADADNHLGWLTLPQGVGGGVFSVRERSPYKDSFAMATLNTATRFEKLAEQWGAILATAHARADKDYRSDIIDYSFDKNVDVRTDGQHAAFRAQVRGIAESYADQVQLDYRAFVGLLANQQSCPAP